MRIEHEEVSDKDNIIRIKRRRAGPQIILELLEILNKHKIARKNWLKDESGLNTKNFNKYFDKLLHEKNFIEHDPVDKIYYRLTNFGKSYLMKASELRAYSKQVTSNSEPHYYREIDKRYTEVIERIVQREINKIMYASPKTTE